MSRSLIVYTDYKSPYAFVANAAIEALEESHRVTIDWRPYTLRIAEFLDPVASRSAHNWRKVRYAYRDARRFANQQGLVLKGPVRIFDAWLASAGMLFAQANGFFPAYHQTVFTRFWAHQLDLDVLDELVAVVEELAGLGAAFRAYAEGPAAAEHEALRLEAEGLGVFGVPTVVLDGELYWGGDRLSLVKERLAAPGRAGG
jgi:2-hydroxychromene-2-carboxylate isomerase